MWSSRVIKAGALRVEGTRRIRAEAAERAGEAGLVGVARGEAVSLLAEARAEAELIMDEVRHQAQEERRAGYLEGHREGWDAARREAEELLGQARALAEATAQEREAWYAGVREEICDLVIALAAKVIAGELSTRPESLVDLVTAAVRELGEAKRVTVSLAPAAARQLSKHEHRLRGRFPALDDLEIREDASLNEGCVAESGDALVDATVDGQLGRMRAALHDSAPGAISGEES